eukprot:364809-Chlamydomonas_euryale.AAC.5
MRVVDDKGVELPHDGKAIGHLQVWNWSGCGIGAGAGKGEGDGPAGWGWWFLRGCGWQVRGGVVTQA